MAISRPRMRVHPVVRAGRRPSMVVMMVMAVVASGECQRHKDRRGEHKKSLHGNLSFQRPNYTN